MMSHTQEYDVTRAVEGFRSLLGENWLTIVEIASLDKTGSYIDDWMQANWEMMVECSLPPEASVILEVYGEGADCNSSGSRVWKPSAQTTHQVHCKASSTQTMIDVLSGDEIWYPAVLDAFCTIKDGWISYAAPFDHVVLQGDNTRAIKAEGLKYIACAGGDRITGIPSPP